LFTQSNERAGTVHSCLHKTRATVNGLVQVRECLIVGFIRFEH